MLKPKWMILGGLSLSLILAAGCATAGGYNLAGVGPKALAMSGAFRAIADDWSAAYWNPAGLAGQENKISLEGKSLFPMVWLTPQVSSSYAGYENYRNGIEQTCAAKAYPVPGMGLVYGINDKLTAGLGVFAPSALGAVWKDLYTGPPYNYGNTVPYPEEGWSSDLKVIDIHPTLAYRVNYCLRLGLGLAV